ncbi:MAG: hypothetical protein N2Z62_14895 [Rhodobacteraceae bacterium]|nr:hypothetical protein [Paracoccaceae bacterium]
MRTLAALVLSAVLINPAFAGGMAEPVMEEEIETQTAAGSRAGILVPILALILIGLAMSNGDDDTGGGGGEIITGD